MGIMCATPELPVTFLKQWAIFTDLQNALIMFGNHSGEDPAPVGNYYMNETLRK